MMDVNYLGSFILSQEVVRGMKARNEGGSVVFTSSQGGLLGLYGFTAYSAAKAALVKLAEALHMEVRGKGRGGPCRVVGPLPSWCTISGTH